MVHKKEVGLLFWMSMIDGMPSRPRATLLPRARCFSHLGMSFSSSLVPFSATISAAAFSAARAVIPAPRRTNLAPTEPPPRHPIAFFCEVVLRRDEEQPPATAAFAVTATVAAIAPILFCHDTPTHQGCGVSMTKGAGEMTTTPRKKKEVWNL